MRRSASQSVTVSNAQASTIHPRHGAWSTMSLVWQYLITPHSCLSFRKQQPERTYAFSAVAAQLTPMWGQPPTHLPGQASAQQQTTYGARHQGCLYSSSHTAAPRIPKFPPLCDPAAVCEVDSCGIIRHEPRRNHLDPFPFLVICPHYPLEEISRSVPPPARTANGPSHRAMF